MSSRVKLSALFVAGAVALAPIAGGATGSTQRVVIESKGSVFAFTLKPLGTGQLGVDAGTTKWSGSSSHKLRRQGQSIEVENVLGTFVGKRGSFEARFRIEWTSAGNGFRAGIASWTIGAATGAYEGLAGEGRSTAIVRPGGRSTMRAEGLLRP